jgi:hypothetical protein
LFFITYFLGFDIHFMESVSMNFSRVSFLLYGVALSSMLLGVTYAQSTMTGQDSSPALIDSGSTPSAPLSSSTTVSQEALPPSSKLGTRSSGSEEAAPAAEEGKSRLRSAYDRSSNPRYYDMLDRLERNQKGKRHHRVVPAQTTTESASPTAKEGQAAAVSTEATVARPRHHAKHSRHHHRKGHHRHTKAHGHAKKPHHGHGKKHAVSGGHHHHKKASSHSLHHHKKAHKHKK